MILFENEHVMIIDKPTGVPCQQGTGLNVHGNPSIDVLANAYLSNSEGAEGFLVHRLDMAASGLMCLAKTHRMAKYLSELMRERLIIKTYTALVCSKFDTVIYPESGMIKHSSESPDKWVIKDEEDDDFIPI